MSPILDIHNEEDAKHCCDYKMSESNLRIVTHYWGRYKYFENENIQRCFESFQINGISKLQVLVWVVYFLIYGIVLISSIVTGEESANNFQKTCQGLRVIIIILALFNYYKIFIGRVTHKASQKEFHDYVNFVTKLSNFIVIAFAVVNGMDYVTRSNLGTCFVVNSETGERELGSPLQLFFFNCNPQVRVALFFICIVYIVHAVCLILISSLLLCLLSCHIYVRRIV
jgi:p-aminobenzoyl-glutamate transporter AbgT